MIKPEDVLSAFIDGVAKDGTNTNPERIALTALIAERDALQER